MNVKQIRDYLRTKIGTNVLIVYFGSRNRKEKYKGVIYQLYRNIFTIKLTSGDIKSFSYIDILTKNIVIHI